MISEFLINIVFNIVSGILNLIPDISWTVDTSTIQPILDIIHLITYFFPMNVVILIFAFYMYIQSFKIGVATLRTVWEILPLV